MLSASYGENIQKYWSENYAALRHFLDYSYVLVQDEFSAFYSICAAAAGLSVLAWKVAAKLRGQTPDSSSGMQRPAPGNLLALAAIVPYVIIACLRNRDPRMNVACIPPLAILASSWVLAVPGRWLRRGLVVLLVAAGSLQLVKATLAVQYPGTLEIRLGSRHLRLFPEEYAYRSRPDTHTWQVQELVRYIHEQESKLGRTGTAEAPGIGFLPDIPRFQGHALQYYLAVLQLPYRMVKVGEHRDSAFGIDLCGYVVTKTGDLTIYSPWAVKYSKEVMQILEEEGDFEKADRTFPLPDGSVAMVYQRVKT